MMYVTAVLPYIVLIIFLGRGLSLRGAADGVSYLFTPDVSHQIILKSTYVQRLVYLLR